MHNNIFIIYNIFDEKMGISTWEIFSLGAGNLARSGFEQLNIFKR